MGKVHVTSCGFEMMLDSTAWCSAGCSAGCSGALVHFWPCEQYGVREGDGEYSCWLADHKHAKERQSRKMCARKPLPRGSLYAHGLLPRLMWLLTVHKVLITTVDGIEWKSNKLLYLLTAMGLYMGLALSSLMEKCKCKLYNKKPLQKKKAHYFHQLAKASSRKRKVQAEWRNLESAEEPVLLRWGFKEPRQSGTLQKEPSNGLTFGSWSIYHIWRHFTGQKNLFHTIST